MMSTMPQPYQACQTFWNPSRLHSSEALTGAPHTRRSRRSCSAEPSAQSRTCSVLALASGGGGRLRRPDEDRADLLSNALADATRRDIVRWAAQGEYSVSALAAAYPMSFAAVQKHVAVLERAGLVTKERRGREQLVRTDAGAVARARHALDELERTWRGRVDRMSALLAQGTEAG